MANDAPRRAARVWLARYNKTQGWLAREMLMSDSLLSAVLNGSRVPTAVFLRRFLRVTGIDLAPYPRNKAGYFTGAPPDDFLPTPPPDSLPSV